MEQPSQKHVIQVAEVSEIVVKTFMLAHTAGATGGVCCDAALSVFISIVSAFEKEQATIDALPYIKGLLEQRMQQRVLSESDEIERLRRMRESETGTMH